VRIRNLLPQSGAFGMLYVLCITTILAPPPAPAQVVATVLHQFRNFLNGEYPSTGVIRDSAGDLYAVTQYGGSANLGVVFKVDTTGSETVLHSFTSTGGLPLPNGGMALDSAGNLYGTAEYGGSSGNGLLFRIDPAGTFTVLYNFAGGRLGGGPTSGVVLDGSGNIYGTLKKRGPTTGWFTRSARAARKLS
jgi:uncharacterized repeat protein (TIGR03803 family)